MLLREHPLLTYRNSRSWPPLWLYCGGFDDTHPQGEVGILKTVYIYKNLSAHPLDRMLFT